MLVSFNEKCERASQTSKSRVPDELAVMVKNDIQTMHASLTFDEFKYKIDGVKIKWNKYPALNEFTTYFLKEWCYHNNQWSRWSRWQLFQTTAGVTITNNCLESFNKQIKSVYTSYQVVSVYQFLLIVIQKIINQHS